MRVPEQVYRSRFFVLLAVLCLVNVLRKGLKLADTLQASEELQGLGELMSQSLYIIVLMYTMQYSTHTNQQ